MNKPNVNDPYIDVYFWQYNLPPSTLGRSQHGDRVDLSYGGKPRYPRRRLEADQDVADPASSMEGRTTSIMEAY